MSLVAVRLLCVSRVQQHCLTRVDLLTSPCFASSRTVPMMSVSVSTRSTSASFWPGRAPGMPYRAGAALARTYRNVLCSQAAEICSQSPIVALCRLMEQWRRAVVQVTFRWLMNDRNGDALGQLQCMRLLSSQTTAN